MKKLPLFLLLFSTILSAQKLTKDDLVDKLADKTCECATNKTITKDNVEIALGMCIIEAISSFEKDVERYYGKDIISNEEKMEALGYDVGKKMAFKCTSIFNFISDIDSDESSEEEEEALQIAGTISEIKQEQFITFSVKEDSGKMNHFILLSDFDNAFLLTDKVLKVNDSVQIDYYELDLYDAKIGKFVVYNIVSDIIKK